MEGIGEMIGTTPRLKGGRGIMLPQTTLGDLCKTPPFARFLRQAQILILEILNVFLPAPWNAYSSGVVRIFAFLERGQN